MSEVVNVCPAFGDLRKNRDNVAELREVLTMVKNITGLMESGLR